jgi:hypothetical protein
MFRATSVNYTDPADTKQEKKKKTTKKRSWRLRSHTPPIQSLALNFSAENSLLLSHAQSSQAAHTYIDREEVGVFDVESFHFEAFAQESRLVHSSQRSRFVRVDAFAQFLPVINTQKLKF